MPLLTKSSRSTTDTNHTRASSSSPERKRGLFSRRRRSSSPSPERKTGHFSRRHDSSPSPERQTGHSSRRSSSSPERKTGLFSRRHASTGSKRAGIGLFGSRRHGIDHDPSIVNARQKVSEAEQAEKDADHALMEARKHVQLARENVNTLEQEAIEEGRIAKLKQAEAKVINKAVKSLGRHGG